MIKINVLVLCCLAGLAYSQTQNYSKAPNSYIYDLELAKSQNYGGIEIPVKKAYEMWANYEYLKTNGSATPIPQGIQTASLYWEDVPGLIENVTIVPGENSSSSKIKVEVNKAKGEGNAVVAFKVDGTIYWSWHIWVTDNPENGIAYSQGTETDIDGNPITVQYMDRNLGAVSGSFLENDWQKSGGLMYEWGRKDPFPPLVYKDNSFYEISGEVGVLKHIQIDQINTIPVQVRPYNQIEKNIQYAVNNPLNYIINTEATGNWFSSSRYKIAGGTYDYVTWDLWSDNAKGKYSHANSSNSAVKMDSRSYELKSEMDPCPNGWRIPSYYGREASVNNLAFFGNKDWNNDDINPTKSQLFPDAINPNLNGIKVYPGLGMDFTNAQSGNRNLGLLSISGAYVFYPNSVSPNALVGVNFQDTTANGGLWSATFGYDGARIFSMISDPVTTHTSVGLHAIYNHQTNPTKAGNAVKCMRDPNMSKIGDFATQYFINQKEDFQTGLNNPNSYVLVNQSNLQIPVSKAFSVYNQILTDHEMPAYNNLVAKVNWSTNAQLISGVSIIKNPSDARNSVINVQINPNESGNAVISLHNGSKEDPVLWSWHIWVPISDPTINTVTYITEDPVAVAYNFVNATQSNLPPLKTTFMDRNLGAESNNLNSGLANGLHYQWGRKDPLPNFLGTNKQNIYLDSGVSQKTINGTNYEANYTVNYDIYSSNNSIYHKKIRAHIKYSVENPLSFMYHNVLGMLYDGGNHAANDLTKINDWVSDDRADAENRWGHGTEKSPFDPCPEGWRVPDVSLTNLYSGSKGNSPWYNGSHTDAYGKPGVIQDQWHDVNTYYGGTTDSSNGWKFETSSFQIGNFPKDGIRGELGSNKISMERSGVWTASLADMNTGFALAMEFQGSKMQTATGAYPQAAMSVRCAKDEKRLLGAPVVRDSGTLDTGYDNIPKPKTADLQTYPNPFKDEFYINSPNAEQFEIYDISGKLVQSGKVNSGKVSAPKLQKGFYLVKIIMENGEAVTKKIIKE